MSDTAQASENLTSEIFTPISALLACWFMEAIELFTREQKDAFIAPRVGLGEMARLGRAHASALM